MAEALPLSIVCTTWNRALSLEKVLVAYTRQTVTDFEFIVADDGSTDDTEAMVQRLAPTLPYPVRYARHANAGFRKAATVNLGIGLVRNTYMLVTDCDSLPHASLLAEHVAAAAPGRLVLGECLRLPQDVTDALTLDAVRAGRYEDARTPDAQRTLDALQRRAILYTWLRQRRKPRVRGNNFSLFLDDYRRVNGYDEQFVGWGNEDGDLRERLKRVGVRPYPIVNRAVVYHIWHAPHESKADLRNKTYAWGGRARPAYCEAGLHQADAAAAEG